MGVAAGSKRGSAKYAQTNLELLIYDMRMYLQTTIRLSWLSALDKALIHAWTGQAEIAKI